MKKQLIKKFERFTLEDLYPLPIFDPLPVKKVRGIAFAAYFLSKNVLKYYTFPPIASQDTLITLLGQNITFSILSFNIAFSLIYVTGKLNNFVFQFDIDYNESKITNNIKVYLPNSTNYLFIYIHETERNKEI